MNPTQSVILVIEDDAAIRRGIVDALEFTKFRVLESGDGREGLKLATEQNYDLLLLDLALPNVSGFESLETLKDKRPNQPVIILTAKGEEQDRLRGLRGGADDYVVKPFSVKELIARVDAVLRRSPARPQPVESFEYSNGVIDFQRREIRYTDGAREELSEKENDLLLHLIVNQGRAISRDELLTCVWKLSPKGISTRTIDMNVARTREKLRDTTPATLLLTVRGKGYMWKA